MPLISPYFGTMLIILSGPYLIAAQLKDTPIEDADIVEEINATAYYPEGPLQIGDDLLYAEMPKDRVLAWSNGSTRIFWQMEGCGPTSISILRHKQIVVLCHLGNFLALIDQFDGSTQIISVDSNGRTLLRPNDSIADSSGGIYFSLSGIFHPRAESTGTICYLSPSQRIDCPFGGLKYANGVALTREGKLLVSEHLGRRIWLYPVPAHGSDDARELFYEFPPAADGIKDAANDLSLAGPDGITVDSLGNIYVVEYQAGKIHILSEEGNLVSTINLPMRYATNIALLDHDTTIAVTGAMENTGRMSGKVVLIRNPIKESRQGKSE